MDDNMYDLKNYIPNAILAREDDHTYLIKIKQVLGNQFYWIDNLGNKSSNTWGLIVTKYRLASAAEVCLYWNNNDK